MDIALGCGGRTLEKVFRSALAQSETEDTITAARDARYGPAASACRLRAGNIISGPVTPVRRSMLRKSRRFNAWKEAQAAEVLARKRLNSERHNGFVSAAPVRRSDAIIDATTPRRFGPIVGGPR